VHGYLFGLMSLLYGKIIVPLMQGILYKHINVFPCNTLNFLLLIVQGGYQEKYENTGLISLGNRYLTRKPLAFTLSSTLDELEELSKKYAILKQQENANESDRAELARVAIKIIDSVSSESFFLPVEKDALSSDGATTYIYQNTATYPAIFDFLAEVLHITVPIEIGRVKFGPGEILVATQDKNQADIELELSTKEMQKLVHARRTEIFTKHAGAAP
jgi:hypothetical protein